MNGVELKPCAHCGAPALLEHGVSGRGVAEFVYCTDPECGMRTPWVYPQVGQEHRKVARIWNRRQETQNADVPGLQDAPPASPFGL